MKLTLKGRADVMINVNIIMSVYNGEKYLKDQIESILNSTVSNWRLFIFDDCSSDSSYEIAEEYARKYKSKIFVYKNPYNIGSNKSFLYNLCRVSEKNRKNDKIKTVNGYIRKNRKKITKKLLSTAGIIKDKAVGFYHSPHIKPQKIRCYEYYMFCDQDDFWFMDKIALTLKKMRKTEKRHGKHKPTLVFTDAVLVDENLKFTEQSFFKTNHMKPKKKNFAHLLMENKCIGCTTMFNQAACDVLRMTAPAFAENEAFNKDYENVRYHDWWMALICSSFGCVRYLNVPTIMYRQHANNQVGQTSFSDYVKSRLSDMRNVSSRLEVTGLQAQSFYNCYKNLLKKKKKNVLEKFISLKTCPPLKKRYYIMRYGFFKSGFVRNVGLMLYV